MPDSHRDPPVKKAPQGAVQCKDGFRRCDAPSLIFLREMRISFLAKTLFHMGFYANFM
jgi:hypothetical protein